MSQATALVRGKSWESWGSVLGTDPASPDRLASEPSIPPQPYHPRDTQDSVLVNLLRDHLDGFIESTEVDGGPGLPARSAA